MSRSGEDGLAPRDGEGVYVVRGVWLPFDEITWRFSASGGPGGQHVNTSNTRAEAVYDIAGSPSLPPWARARLLDVVGPTLTVAASDTRSQSRNRDLARRRLVDRMARALTVTPTRHPTRPTQASQRRRLEEKRRRGQVKRERREGRGRTTDTS